ncbi:MAG: sulfotransferase, partial [Proteobacteria bacterium]|nr:sulfotransferase [Pseudomonadota bacterium]
DLSLPELSAQYFQGIILQLLVNRLEVTRLIKTHPEILEEIIEKPVFIIGLPRSGTTILHTLMALDPCSRFLRNYECSGAILPPPELIPGAIDPRIEATHKAMEGFLGAAPQLRGINGLNFMAYGTAECQNLMAHEFCHLGYSAGSSLFSYGDWLSRTDLEPAYKTHKLLLQILQWKLPNERWVLKAPIHLFGLDHLLATYPDAEIVFTHRAPYDAIQSGISMIYHWTEFTTQQADIEAIVNWWPKLMAGALKKALKVRKKI